MPATFVLDDGTQLYCQHEVGHHGPHTWERRPFARFGGGITREEVERRAAAGSPAAQALLALDKPK